MKQHVLNKCLGSVKSDQSVRYLISAPQVNGNKIFTDTLIYLPPKQQVKGYNAKQRGLRVLPKAIRFLKKVT